MKKAVSFLLTLALLAGLLSAWAAGPAGPLSVYFYDETAQRDGELPQTDRVSLTLDGSFENVAALRAHLAAQGDRWALALDEGKLLAAVNQTLVELTHPLADGDGVAFVPPGTGG